MSTTARTTISLPEGFEFNEVKPIAHTAGTPPPSLGPLAAFAGTFSGSGFNTIFRPNSPNTPTQFPIPAGGDNVLELNLTHETLAFSPALGSVPNRGKVQADIFLNGVPYLQSVSDVTVAGQSVGIHVEPGIWVIAPPTTDPAITTQTVTRMASIPHGVTIEAQGTFSTAAGKPTIPPVNINPFSIGGAQPPANQPVFPSQIATNENTARIPQNLASYIAAGTITQAILEDPNTVLRNAIANQNITETTTIKISTAPPAPLFGGGTDNIAFLLGDNHTPPQRPNAQTFLMTATFWIETVEQTILVPVFTPGQPPLTIKGVSAPGRPAATFTVTPPIKITTPREITVTHTQIQYSQVVTLNFNTLSWPHVSVATLVPADAIPVPPSVWG